MKDEEEIERAVSEFRSQIESDDLGKYVKELKKSLTWRMKLAAMGQLLFTTLLFAVTSTILILFVWMLLKLLIFIIGKLS